jgi:DivIVA domain-containing protein
VALDRQSIEKRDFPIGRRGYDTAAVDAHLALLAGEVEALKSASRPRADTLASAASEQVRLILEASEQSAAEITRDADLESRRILEEAHEEAARMRAEAGTQAREHVEQVSKSVAGVLERIDALEGEMLALMESLRSGATRVSADLTLLQAAVADVRAPATADEPRPRKRSAAAAPGAAKEPAIAAPEPVEPADEPIDEDVIEVVEAGIVVVREADEEGARLIALNMALNGTPRDETEQYLQENFELDDPQGLLDDVYARAGQ